MNQGISLVSKAKSPLPAVSSKQFVNQAAIQKSGFPIQVSPASGQRKLADTCLPLPFAAPRLRVTLLLDFRMPHAKSPSREEAKEKKCCQTQPSSFPKSQPTKDLPKSSPPSFATPPPGFSLKTEHRKLKTLDKLSKTHAGFPPARNGSAPRARGRRPNTSQLYTLGWHRQALSPHFLENSGSSREAVGGIGVGRQIWASF